MSTPAIPPTIDGAYRSAWDALRAHFWPLMGAILLTFAAGIPSYAASAVANAADGIRSGAGLPFAVLANAYSLLVTTPLGFGLVRLTTRAVRGEGVRFEHLVEPFRSLRMYLSTLGASLLAGVIGLAAIAPGLVIALMSGCGAVLRAGAAHDEPAIQRALASAAVGLIFSGVVMLVPLLWVMTRLAFVNSCVADGGANPVEAVARSWAMTRGHAVTVLLLLLSGAPLMLLGCAACCVGFVPALALLYLALGSLYVALGGFVRTPASA